MNGRPDFITILRQDEFWWTQQGVRIRIEDMDPGHRRNTLAMQRRNANAMKARYDFLACMTGPDPSIDSDATCDAFDAGLDQLWDTPAVQWLEEQPFIVRLRKLVEGDEAR